MPGARPEKRHRDLNAETFAGLLHFLAPDPVAAAKQYERIREKLVRFFEWKGCIPADTYADETIDRVAARVAEGIPSEPENPYLYFHGVALYVVKEHWRKAPKEPQSLETIREPDLPAVHPSALEQNRSKQAEVDRRLACLQDCLDRLPAPHRGLLTVYHLDKSASRLAARKDLAETLHLPPGALRLRVFRIRRQLERCVKVCMTRSSSSMESETIS